MGVASAENTVEATMQVAKRLVELCRQGDHETAMKELYAPEIVHEEAMAYNGGSPRTEGIEAVMKSGQEWEETFEVHSQEISEPIVAPGVFAITMKCDSTHKPSGKRIPMEEICVYAVNKGKIVKANFFYDIHGEKPEGM
jgi:ketosteroid isomerase-like protein